MTLTFALSEFNTKMGVAVETVAALDAALGGALCAELGVEMGGLLVGVLGVACVSEVKNTSSKL